MINNKSSNWQLLWGLVFVNIVLLALAITSDVTLYLLSSIVWSLITIKYYNYLTNNELKEDSEKTVQE